VIDWTQAHENLLKMTANNDDGVGNVKLLTKNNCAEIQKENGPLVEEGSSTLIWRSKTVPATTTPWTI
jgi:hypothetical protein